MDLKNSYDIIDLFYSKLEKAVALRYNEEIDRAPVVVASGRGEIAKKIIEIAKKENIPFYEDKDLVEILSAVDVGKEIPPDLYTAVAEVLSFIYRANEEGKGNEHIK